MARSRIQTKVEAVPKRWLNKQEAMAYLGVGEDYLARLRNEAKISFSKRGTHQYEKSKESSYVIAYNGGGTARKVMDENGKITYE